MNKYIVRFYDEDFDETWNTVLSGNNFYEAFEDFEDKFKIDIRETGESFTIECYEFDKKYGSFF